MSSGSFKISLLHEPESFWFLMRMQLIGWVMSSPILLDCRLLRACWTRLGLLNKVMADWVRSDFLDGTSFELAVSRREITWLIIGCQQFPLIIHMWSRLLMIVDTDIPAYATVADIIVNQKCFLTLLLTPIFILLLHRSLACRKELKII